MTSLLCPAASRSVWRAVLLAIWAAVAMSCPDQAVAADARTGKVQFDIPAGVAERTLKEFSLQSGLEVLFVTDAAGGVKTNAVKGEFTPREAIDRLLLGTALVTTQDERTGTVRVRRSADPNELRAAPIASRDRPTTAPSLEEVVAMSPFEVTSANDKGYFATNTMSGTRLNTKIADLGASITVITKQQMQDFGLLDINDIFSYEASTEGTGNYTDFSFDRNGNPVDNTQLNPESANRIRGLGAANITFDGFETSGRIPIDPVDIDAVEITRGPNASLFGIGNAAGTVNTVRASANPSRNKTQVIVRADSFDGYRSSLDVNRVLKKDVLAARGSIVYQRSASPRKPSGTDTLRLNAMVKYRPFKTTTISASYSYYRLDGNRPNTTTPLEVISGWRAAGSPTWDPITTTAKINGVVVGTFATTVPPYFTQGNLAQYSNAFVDGGGIQYWATGQTTSSVVTPNNSQRYDQNQRLVQPVNDITGALGGLPLFQKSSAVHDKSIYDWSTLNFAAANRIEMTNRIASVLLEQSIVNRPGHRLAAQLGWFRESDASYARNLIGSSPPINTIQNVLAIDVNERRLDGSPNPFFLRPYFLAAHPTTTQRPLERDSYRGQIAYSLDLTKERTFLRWLGQHDLVGYGEYKNVVSRSLNFSDIIVDAHSWLPRGVWRGSSFANLPAGPASYTAGVNYWMYVGSRGGTRVETPPPAWQPGNYVLNWGNGVTGVFNQEPAQLGSAPTGGGTAGNSWTQLKARGAILQSRLLGDRLVPTFGYRFDKRYSRAGAPVTGDGVNLDYDSFYGWAGGDWNVGKGPTRTKGVVVKPTQWLSFYVNKSDSFQPATSAQTVYLKRLADPRGNGQDSGIWLNLFQNRLSIRAGQYKTGIVGTRNGTSGTLVTRALFIDRPNVPGQTGSARGYQLQPLATRWATDAAAARGVQLTQDQLTTEVAKIMGLDPKFLQEYSLPISSSDDTLATGEEIEINFNPTTFWTVKANLAQQESINKNLAPEISQWMQERIKVWSGIIDPQLGVPWYTHNYPGGVPADVVASTVMAPLALAQATEGKSRPQIRKYRFNLTSSFRLAALTDQTILKRINVGGAVRWEDRGAIGYRGLEGSTTAYDPNRPVYDKAHHYLDAFAAYRTRIGSNGMAATLQLNVRNLNESGRLQPVAVQPDGTPSAYRIIDPRLFILSLTLDL